MKMRWTSILTALASASAVSASKPGSPGQRIARYNEMMNEKAQTRAAAREEMTKIASRQSGDKYLTEKTQRMQQFPRLYTDGNTRTNQSFQNSPSMVVCYQTYIGILESHMQVSFLLEIPMTPTCSSGSSPLPTRLPRKKSSSGSLVV